MEKTVQKRFLCNTIKTQTLAAALAVIAAVALPQLLHLMGMGLGLGSALGEVFLPMHIAIFLVGYLAGPWAGLAAGILSPAISFFLTSAFGTAMPALPMLPYMMVELGIYGLATGLLQRFAAKLPVIVSLLIAQVAGRAVRALALVIGVLGFGFGPGIAVIWNSILTGLPGLALQWILIPLILYLVRKRTDHHA